ncbi:MAG: DUF2341 domain-containing protein, partial [Promethearchaeota archaeon]
MILSTNSKNTLRTPTKLVCTSVTKKWRRVCFGIIIPCFIMLMFCSPASLTPNQAVPNLRSVTRDSLLNSYRQAGESQEYSSSGASQPVAFNGLFSNATQPIVMLDSSASASVPITTPQGWTANSLSGTTEHISTQISQLTNGLLDDYHTERYIITGSPWNSETFYLPDGWSLVKKGDSTPHPGHGGLYWYTSAGSGRESSMGWRPSVLFDTTKTLDPNMEIYLSQQVQLPWREVYSCRVSFYHRVPSSQTLNGMFYLFVRIGNYEARFSVFDTGYTTDTWLQGYVDVPASVFSSIPVPGSVSLAIGLSTDFSGQPPSNINNYVYIDEIEATFTVRPFPEQIGLGANQTVITGTVPGSIMPFVPDGANRDCVSRSDTGISVTATPEVGVYSSSGSAWTDVVKYQTGIQFPLNIPRGAVITSARLEIEALGEYSSDGDDNTFRVWVAAADNMAPFVNGANPLETQYPWIENSIDWAPNYWTADYRYASPDISSLVQAVVSRSGWSNGNYIGIMIGYMFSDNYRDYNTIKGTWSYGGGNLARLYVDFMIPQEEDTISVQQYSKELTIDHTKVSANLENFPVLVDIIDADLKNHARSDGEDIRFVSGSETLDYQVEVFDPNYNGTHAHLIAWVQVPYLSATEDTVISMQYGAPEHQRIENSADIWQGYESVWHLSEQSGTAAYLTDSSNNGHEGEPTLTSYMQNGMIDGARYSEDVGGNYISFVDGQGIFDGWSDWQFSFWIYFNFSTDTEFWSNEWRVFDKGTSMSLARTFDVGVPGYANFQVDVHFNGYDAFQGVLVKRQAWNYVVFKYESSGDGRYRGYSFVDGALLDSFNDNTLGTGGSLRNDPNKFVICTDGGGTPFRGGIDEFRVMNGYKSAGWIQTEYANQYDPSGFLTQGVEQTTQLGEKTDLLFFTSSESVVEILPRLRLNVIHSDSTLDAFLEYGTSFSVSNDTDASWTANVLVNPPSGVGELSFNLSNPVDWTLTDVTDSDGTSRLPDATTTGTQVIVPSSVLDVYGIWVFKFSANNEASLLECGANAGAYGNTVALQVGDSAKFRGTATVIPGSAMRLHLVDPSGQLFYSTDDLSQDGSGQFEWTGISVTSAWPNGIWEAYVDFNNTADSSPERVGRYSRLFTVKHGSSLNLLSPADAIGDGVSVRTAGELLEIEVQLTDTDTAQNVAGSTVTMNWSISGVETQVQFEDYGNGVYGKTLNTSDLTQAGNWRLNIVSTHPHLIDATTYFDLELSRNTILTYTTPSSTPYGDDFSVRVNLQDAITGTYYDGASFTSNGTISGVTDYSNGTYLVNIDSAALSIGTYCFEINANPSQSLVIGSSVDVVFRYREVKTDLVQVEINPVSVPWGQNATVVLKWQDMDHGGLGISGGTLSGDGTFQYTDLLDGRYSIDLDVESYGVGIYLFNFTIDGNNYQTSGITVAVTLIPHRTIVMATYDGSISLGSNVTVTLELLDIDDGNTAIVGNLTSVSVEWSGGSSVYGSLQFQIEAQDWPIGTYTIDITIHTTISPRYFYDGTTAILLKIQKLATVLSWDDVGVFPIGDDFEITTYVTVNDSSSTYDGLPVNGLLQSQFSIKDKNGTTYSIKTFSDQGAGTYVLTLDHSYFQGGAYGIRIFLIFGLTENYSSVQTPIISFQFNQARSDLSSPDYPLLTISYSTNAIITLEYVDIDRGQGIDSATIYVTGASKLGQLLISSGRYRVTLDTSTWSIGVYTVNFTASALNYEDKAISINITIRQIRTYATATVSDLEIPVGDTRTFYVDYIDMDHGIPIFTLNHLCNWTIEHYDIVWTGSRYSITI